MQHFNFRTSVFQHTVITLHLYTSVTSDCLNRLTTPYIVVINMLLLMQSFGILLSLFICMMMMMTMMNMVEMVMVG